MKATIPNPTGYLLTCLHNRRNLPQNNQRNPPMPNIQRKWLILIATGMMILLVNIDMTIVNLALAKIAVTFHSDMNEMQWIISSYLLSTAVMFTIFGRLADRFGRKKISLIGVFIFTVSSLVAGLAPNLNVLIAARFAQGLGFASTLGLSLLIARDAFPKHQHGLATGATITITGIGQAIGPTLGGVILQHFSWGWIFLINVPIGIVSLIMTAILVPQQKAETLHKTNINPLNVLIYVVGLSLVLFVINQLSVMQTSTAIIFAIIGFALLTVFYQTSLKSSRPLVDITLLQNNGYLFVVSLRFLFMGFFSGLLFIVPLYLQNILGMAPLHAGATMVIMTAVVAISSPIAGKMIDLYGFARPLFSGFVFAFIACITMLTFGKQISPLFLIISFFCWGLAIGIHIPTSITGALSYTPKNKSGTAIGLFFTVAISGSIIGVAMAGSMIKELSQHSVNALLQASNISLPGAIREQLYFAANGTRRFSDLIIGNQNFIALKEITQTAFLSAFHDLLGVLSILMFIAAIGGWVIVRKNKK